MIEFGAFDTGGAGTRVIPCLPSRDLDRTEAFFAGLGFETGRPAPDGGYLIVRRQWVELHFRSEPGMDPAVQAESCYIRVADVDGVAASLAEASPVALPGPGFPAFHPPRDRPWAMREAYLFDPDNNLLKIGTPIHAREHA